MHRLESGETGDVMDNSENVHFVAHCVLLRVRIIITMEVIIQLGDALIYFAVTKEHQIGTLPIGRT
jgi:hypothetical protein